MTSQGIIGIYLAAGKSKRFGGNKLLQNVGDHKLGSIALMTALESKLEKMVIITDNPNTPNWLTSVLLHPPYRDKWLPITCDESYKGQAHSLKKGINYAIELHAEAAMIILADQPLISKNMINELIVRYEQGIESDHPYSFVASSHKGLLMPPILFSHEMFPMLLQLKGDKGARSLIRNSTELGSLVEFSDPDLFFDVDTKKDFHSLLTHFIE